MQFACLSIVFHHTKFQPRSVLMYNIMYKNNENEAEADDQTANILSVYYFDSTV